MKSFRIFFVFLVTWQALSAQEIEWQNTIGGNSNDAARSIRATPDGGFIIGGESMSGVSIDKTEPQIGATDFWVVKLDASGNIQWQNTIGGAWVDFLSALELTADGGYICGGPSSSWISGDKTEDTLDQTDYWIIKLDSTGNIQWQNTIGGNSFDYMTRIQQTTDGGYICGGHSSSGISGDKSEAAFGSYYDYWILKLDSSGNILWQKTIGGTLIDNLFELIQTNDGGYIAAGHSSSGISGNKTTAGNGLLDYYLVKLDNSGNIQWQKSFGGDLDDLLDDFSATPDGGFICGGHSFSGATGDKTENNVGSYDFWILKLDSNANIQWQNTIGGSNMEEHLSVRPAPGGGYICSGSSNSGVSGDKTEFCRFNDDYWLIKLDSAGRIEWQKTLGGNAADNPLDLATLSSGNYVIAGQSLSGISYDKSEIHLGGGDFWIVKITDEFNLINGTMYADMNLNSVRDSNEIALTHIRITESNTGRFNFTGPEGQYSVSVIDTGSFSVSPNAAFNYYSISPPLHTASFNNFLQTDLQNDFAVQPTGIFNDLEVKIFPTMKFVPGSGGGYHIRYSNVGTTDLSPTIIFYPDTSIDFSVAIPAPNSVTPDSIVFILPVISPFSTASVNIYSLMSPTIPIGTVISSAVSVLPVTGDASPAGNHDSCDIITVGSYDPNEMHVDRTSMYDFELPGNSWLEYHVFFQNTGTYPASFVQVNNFIPAALDMTTFEMIGSSHPCSVQWQPYDDVLKFVFNSIMLPDSNTNEPMSHGFVRYRIRPQAALLVGDTIFNSAAILFDYNAPVITNTVSTAIIAPTSINEYGQESVFIYPNPVAEDITITLNHSQEGNVLIDAFNVFGQRTGTIFNGKIHTGTTHIKSNISRWAPGVYFIRVSGSRVKYKVIKL